MLCDSQADTHIIYANFSMDSPCMEHSMRGSMWGPPDIKPLNSWARDKGFRGMGLNWNLVCGSYTHGTFHPPGPMSSRPIQATLHGSPIGYIYIERDRESWSYAMNKKNVSCFLHLENKNFFCLVESSYSFSPFLVKTRERKPVSHLTLPISHLSFLVLKARFVEERKQMMYCFWL